MNSRVYFAIQSGYDTHDAQAGPHANLLSEFAGAVRAFFRDLAAANLAERVVLMAFSEFGRRVEENGADVLKHDKEGSH